MKSRIVVRAVWIAALVATVAFGIAAVWAQPGHVKNSLGGTTAICVGVLIVGICADMVWED